METNHHNHTELHFLPIPPPPPPSTSHHRRQKQPSFHHTNNHSLDLQLSISLNPFKPPKEPPLRRRVELLRWQAAEQRRLAAMEKAYAERVMEMTRREMELAQSELARAHILWDRTKEDLSRVDRIKENSIVRVLPQFQHQVSSLASNSNTEIICNSCRRRFHPPY